MLEHLSGPNVIKPLVRFTQNELAMHQSAAGRWKFKQVAERQTLMPDMKRYVQNAMVLSLFLSLVATRPVLAQDKMTIQATAFGTSTQSGRIYNINIYIEQFSTPAERQALIDAFKKHGQDGMVSVLEDMKPKGRIRFSMGGVGNDIKHIAELPSKTGRKFRLVTDRWLSLAELYNGTRSRDYMVGAIELTITPDGKGSGTLMPACKLKMNKKSKQLEVEAYQNPWKLNNFIVTNK